MRLTLQALVSIAIFLFGFSLAKEEVPSCPTNDLSMELHHSSYDYNTKVLVCYYSDKRVLSKPLKRKRII